MPPLSVNKPYPDVNELSPDARALRIISPAYAGAAGELNAVLLYTYAGLLFGREGHDDFAEAIGGIAVAEMVHLKLLGGAITALGAAPVFTANPPCLFNFYSSKYVVYSRTLINVAEDGIRAEKQAIRGYERMLGMLKNARVSELIARIVEDERLHLAEWEKILKAVKS